MSAAQIEWVRRQDTDAPSCRRGVQLDGDHFFRKQARNDDSDENVDERRDRNRTEHAFCERCIGIVKLFLVVKEQLLPLERDVPDGSGNDRADVEVLT